MSRDKQIEEIVIAKNCAKCVHNEVCQELEHFRDPLGWVNTEGEFVCSYYDKASEVAEEIFSEIDKVVYQLMNNLNYSIGNAVYDLAELKKKYTEDNNYEV